MRGDGWISQSSRSSKRARARGSWGRECNDRQRHEPPSSASAVLVASPTAPTVPTAPTAPTVGSPTCHSQAARSCEILVKPSVEKSFTENLRNLGVLEWWFGSKQTGSVPGSPWPWPGLLRLHYWALYLTLQRRIWGWHHRSMPGWLKQAQHGQQPETVKIRKDWNSLEWSTTDCYILLWYTSLSCISCTGDT